MATIVDWSSLAEAAYVSIAVGLGVLVVAAIGVASSLRAEDERNAGHEGGVIAFGAVTVVCVIGLVGAIVAGIYLLTK
jgi:hypothetical protein